ncbi:MAG: UMP kinase [Gammaproteobacteria bacterium]|nr:MAG: UMP kinase [Gammaproteobacteria bacterium]
MSHSASPRRVLLKLSGEALMGTGDFGIDPAVLGRLARDIAGLAREGIQFGVVIGGGNIFRGAGLAGGGFDRVRGDQIGMLATVMNGLAMQDHLLREGVEARTLSAFRIDTVCEPYSRDLAVSHLEAGRVVMLTGGTGNPYFTTDSAASLRAIEIGADLMIKATKVDGVYSADPEKDPDAEFYPRLSYDRILAEGLGVMDATAVVLCKENGMPLRVMNINEPDALRRVMQGEEVGTLVTGDDG